MKLPESWQRKQDQEHMLLRLSREGKVDPEPVRNALADMDRAYDQGYSLLWFQLQTYRSSRFVLYGFGHWVMHIMDWRGSNFMHGRLPGSPIFNTKVAAASWLKGAVRLGLYQKGDSLPGHHYGDQGCRQCGDRVVCDFSFNGLPKPPPRKAR